MRSLRSLLSNLLQPGDPVGHLRQRLDDLVQPAIHILPNIGPLRISSAPCSAPSYDCSGGTLKKCVNSQAVYPLCEQNGLKAQERRYTAREEGKHRERVCV